MSEHRTPDDLKSLRERLDRLRSGTRPATDGGSRNTGAMNSALGMGLRIGLELVVAVAVGVGLGWLADQGLGTRPWAMLAGIVVGFAAGVVNVYRAMKGLGLAAGYRPAPPVVDEDEED